LRGVELHYDALILRAVLPGDASRLLLGLLIDIGASFLMEDWLHGKFSLRVHGCLRLRIRVLRSALLILLGERSHLLVNRHGMHFGSVKISRLDADGLLR
jgi:hypothetical protein